MFGTGKTRAKAAENNFVDGASIASSVEVPEVDVYIDDVNENDLEEQLDRLKREHQVQLCRMKVSEEESIKSIKAILADREDFFPIQNLTIPDHTECTSIMSGLSALKLRMKELRNWKEAYVAKHQDTNRSLLHENKKLQDRVNHVELIYKQLDDRDTVLQAELMSLQMSTTETIKKLNGEMESLQYRNNVLEADINAYKGVIDNYQTEQMCLPRLEEQLFRDARAQVKEKDTEIRRREKTWRKIEADASNFTHWRSKATQLEIQLHSTKIELDQCRKQLVTCQSSAQRAVAEAQKELRLFRNNPSLYTSSSAVVTNLNSASALTSLHAQNFRALVANKSISSHNDSVVTASIDEHQHSKELPAGHGPEQTGEADSNLLRMTDKIVAQLKSELAKQKEQIVTLTVQLSKARAAPLLTMAAPANANTLHYNANIQTITDENSKPQTMQETYRTLDRVTVQDIMRSYEKSVMKDESDSEDDEVRLSEKEQRKLMSDDMRAQHMERVDVRKKEMMTYAHAKSAEKKSLEKTNVALNSKLEGKMLYNRPMSAQTYKSAGHIDAIRKSKSFRGTYE